MPIYLYACPECKSTFELVCPVGERDLQSCDACGAPANREEIPQTRTVLYPGGRYRPQVQVNGRWMDVPKREV